MAETLTLKGIMQGHTDMVTAIATPVDNPDSIVTSSRDKSILVWTLTKDAANASTDPATAIYGIPHRRLTGHSHFVQDVVLSSDDQFALSGSWDGELRLWDLSTGVTTRRFVGHTKDVLSVAFSADNRQIVSASRDRSIKLWNTLGECKYTIQDADGHTNWVSCVRFSPNILQPTIVSGSWDRTVKVWNLTNCECKYTIQDADGHANWVSCVRFSPNILQPTIVSGSWDRTVKVWNLTNCKLRCTLAGHAGYVNTVAVSPDGSLCASGGKDGVTLLWDLAEGKKLYSLDAGDIIHALCFSPNRYWLCAATQESVKIWDLESKSVVQDLKPSETQTLSQNKKMLYCTSLSWSSDGSTLFTGYTDGTIRVWEISRY